MRVRRERQSAPRPDICAAARCDEARVALPAQAHSAMRRRGTLGWARGHVAVFGVPCQRRQLARSAYNFLNRHSAAVLDAGRVTARVDVFALCYAARQQRVMPRDMRVQHAGAARGYGCCPVIVAM